jgi:nucleotide-binding universal stress UspA family protein
MAGFTSILCALDTSEVAPRVLRHAVGIADAFGARLTVLSVCHGDARAAEKVMRDQVAAALPPGAAYPADLQVRALQLAMGTVVDALLDAAGQDVDLIVAGTNSKSGLSRWLLGSTSAAILAETPCATLLVPQGDVEIVRLELDRALFCPGAVLVAIDLAEHNERQLALASHVAARAGQPLIVMTVASPGQDVGQLKQALAARAAEAGAVPVSTVVVTDGPVAAAIDRVAVAEHAGLVVMGLRRRGGRGEVATAVLQTKDAIVLAVPPSSR